MSVPGPGRTSARGWRVGAVVLLTIIGAAYLWRLGNAPIMTWDEGLYAATTRYMGYYHSPLIPVDAHGEFWGWYGKPPLVNWLIMASAALFGYSNWALRLPFALSTVGCIGLTGLWGHRLGGRWLGLASAVAFATMRLPLEHGRRATIETPLVMFGLAAGYLYARGTDTWGGPRRLGRFMAAGACFGAAILTKQAASVVLLPLVFGSELAVAGVPRRERALRLAVFGGTALLVAGWWFVWAWLQVGDELLHHFFGYHVIGRLGSERTNGGPANFVNTLAAHDTWPYHPLVGLAGLAWLQWRLRREDRRRALVPVAGYLAGAFVVFGIAAPRLLPWYPLHVLPALAIGVGAIVAGLAASPRRAAGAVALAALVGVAGWAAWRHQTFRWRGDDWEQAGLYLESRGVAGVVLDSRIRSGIEQAWYFGASVRGGEAGDIHPGEAFVTRADAKAGPRRAASRERFGNLLVFSTP